MELQEKTILLKNVFSQQNQQGPTLEFTCIQKLGLVILFTYRTLDKGLQILTELRC